MSDITSRKCSIAELNAVPGAEFVGRLGGIFEHSPWVAEAAAAARPFASIPALLEAMTGAVASAGTDKQLALINAHPDLAGRLAKQGLLTSESTREQAAAGLDQIDAATLQKIDVLNTAYRERFHFPFIICARLNSVTTIVTAMELRLGNSREAEIATALEEIFKIARLRLADIVTD